MICWVSTWAFTVLYTKEGGQLRGYDEGKFARQQDEWQAGDKSVCLRRGDYISLKDIARLGHRVIFVVG